MLSLLKRWRRQSSAQHPVAITNALSELPVAREESISSQEQTTLETISPSERAEIALMRSISSTWEEMLGKLYTETMKDAANASLSQMRSEMMGATGDFSEAMALHLAAAQSDSALKRTLRMPSNSMTSHPTIQCAISNICNINCRICETQDSLAKKGNMDFKLLQAIVDQCKEMGINHMGLHHVNEPLLHPSIFNILNYLEDKSIDVTLSTNGNETKSVLRRASKQPRLPRKINIRYSIDAGTAATYNEIRRGGDFDRVIEGMALMRDFCAERGIALTTGANYVMTAKSVGELADFYDAVSEFVPYQNMYFSIVNGNTPTGLNHYIRDNRVTEFVRRSPCEVPFQTFNILKDGRVSLCCVDFNEEAIVGDLRNQTISEVWNDSPELQRARTSLESQDVANLPNLCKRCYIAEAWLADAGINQGIQQLFRMKAAGQHVSNENLRNRIRFELMMHGLDFADPSTRAILTRSIGELLRLRRPPTVH